MIHKAATRPAPSLSMALFLTLLYLVMLCLLLPSEALGEPHAEALAITKAGKAARGATLYVSLEPCCQGRVSPA